MTSDQDYLTELQQQFAPHSRRRAKSLVGLRFAETAPPDALSLYRPPSASRGPNHLVHPFGDAALVQDRLSLSLDPEPPRPEWLRGAVAGVAATRSPPGRQNRGLCGATILRASHSADRTAGELQELTPPDPTGPDRIARTHTVTSQRWREMIRGDRHNQAAVRAGSGSRYAGYAGSAGSAPG